METLNLSHSTPRSDNRLKSLFWPSIQSGAEVDSLGEGYGVCTIVAVISLIALVVGGQAFAGVVIFLIFYLGGVGVGKRSRYAAAITFGFYVGAPLFRELES